MLSANLSENILAAVLRSAALYIRLRNILLKWFVTIVFTLPKRRSNISIRNTLGRYRKSYSFSENDLKHEITLTKNLLRKESKLPTSLEQLFSCIAT